MNENLSAEELKEIAAQCFHAGNKAMLEYHKTRAPYLKIREEQLKTASRLIGGLVPEQVRDEEEI